MKLPAAKVLTADATTLIPSRQIMNLTEFHLQLFGLAMIFYVVVTLGFAFSFDLLVGAAKVNDAAPVMALEFVRTAGEIHNITKDADDKTKDDPKLQKGLQTFLLFDAFAFVPVYFGFLLLMSFFLSQSSLTYASAAAVGVVFIAIIAASADWAENYYSYKALETIFADPDQSVPGIYAAALIKWVSIFIATGILSMIFWRGGWWNAAAVLIAISSLTGLAGLVVYKPLIGLSVLVQLITLFVTGIMFTFSVCRKSFLRGG